MSIQSYELQADNLFPFLLIVLSKLDVDLLYGIGDFLRVCNSGKCETGLLFLQVEMGL